MNNIISLLLILVLGISISGCKFMPYKNDFDCPIPTGLKCKSLYEVNKMADQGLFYPDCNKENNEHP